MALKTYIYELINIEGKYHAGEIKAFTDTEALERFHGANIRYLARTVYNKWKDEVEEIVLIDAEAV